MDRNLDEAIRLACVFRFAGERRNSNDGAQKRSVSAVSGPVSAGPGTTPDGTPVKRPRGRPKGSKTKPKPKPGDAPIGAVAQPV